MDIGKRKSGLAALFGFFCSVGRLILAEIFCEFSFFSSKDASFSSSFDHQQHHESTNNSCKNSNEMGIVQKLSSASVHAMNNGGGGGGAGTSATNDGIGTGNGVPSDVIC